MGEIKKDNRFKIWILIDKMIIKAINKIIRKAEEVKIKLWRSGRCFNQYNDNKKNNIKIPK